MSTTITGLPNATTPLSGTERVPMDQSGATKDATTQDIANLAPGTDLSYTAATRVLASSTGADATLPLATGSDAGLMAAADKTKLDGIAAGATANATDAQLRDRSTHTGTQAASTISDSTAAGRALLTAADAAAQRTSLGLGTAATVNTGTSAGNVVALDGSGKLPAVDGSALTGLPPGITDLGYTASSRLLTSSTGADVTLPLFDAASSNAGLVPGSSTGGTTNFLRADGTWAAPPSSPPGGSTTQIQFNDGGSFGGDADLTYDKTTNLLTTKGDINLDDGGSFTTTLQTITPTANRTLSLPDATGTVALVAGSSGQLIWNSSGAYAGASTLTYDGSILTTSGRFINSYNATASSPAKVWTGTWFTGGTATTTKPQVLIEPTGTTSTGWSTSGTGLGVNAASGFAGNLLDLQVNGTRLLRVDNFAVYGSGSEYVRLSSGVSVWAGANHQFFFNASGFGIRSFLGGGVTGQVFLLNDAGAADILAQRNGTAAQTFRIYNTHTSDTNLERGKLEWSGNVFRVGTEKGSGGGTARALELQTDGTTRLSFGASTGAETNFVNGASLLPAKALVGTWATGFGTTNTKPQLLIEPTGTTSTGWSNSGTGLGVNAASGFAGNLLDLQLNGSPRGGITSAGNGYALSFSLLLSGFALDGNAPTIWRKATGEFYYGTQSQSKTGYIGTNISIGTTGAFSWGIDSEDLFLRRDAANTLAQRNSTNAQTFRCYGTYTDASNYVRAALSSTSTAVTLAAETAGTGADDIPLNLTAAGTGTVKVNSVAEVAVSSTVAGLPAAPAVGMITRVTDATAPAVGSAVTGGGSAAALVWYNGAAWNVIGV